MMKGRSNRSSGEQAAISNRNKPDPAAQAQLLNNTQANAQVIRKRRSSINVYDQPSSLNSRLRQLETDMLRLDEDRAKLYDDTHSALAQYELKLNEIHAILKSRQDNVDKYVEDMRLLLQAKDEFERQAKLLHEKHDRVHEKFMHRETTISREIKLLKNKFELLEKSRQFRSILQKSTSNMSMGDIHNHSATEGSLDGLGGESSGSTPGPSLGRTRSGATASEINSLNSAGLDSNKPSQLLRLGAKGDAGVKSVRIKLARLNPISRLLRPLMHRLGWGKAARRRTLRRKSNRVASVANGPADSNGLDEPGNTGSTPNGASVGPSETQTTTS